MRLRPVAAALLIAFAPVSVGVPALAQDDATTSDARARFKEGVRYYEGGQYERARASFLQAYALKKHPDVLFNLANACLKSGHPREADRYFSQWLHDGDGVTPQKRSDAEKGRDEARSKLGRVDVAAPSGTQVTVDGEAAMPGEAVYVEPGAHVVKFHGSDGTDQTVSVSVLAGQARSATFGKASPTPPTDTTSHPTTPPPSDTGNTTTPPPDATTPPPADSTKPPEPPAPHAKSKLATPPDNLVPVFIGGGLAVIGFGIGIGVGVVAKGSAQTSATGIANQIQGYLDQHPTIKAQGGSYPCSSTNPNVTKNIGAACAQLNTNNSTVNSDAVVGNIGLAIGIAALIGTGIYWAVATRGGDDSKAAATNSTPVITPIIGPGLGGLTIGGRF